MISSNTTKKKLEKINGGLLKDIETFTEIVVQAEVKEAEKETERHTSSPNNRNSTNPNRFRAGSSSISPSIPAGSTNPEDPPGPFIHGDFFIHIPHIYNIMIYIVYDMYCILFVE